MRAAGIATAVAALAAGCYATWLEPRRVGLTRLELSPIGWPAGLDGFTILHLSDLHTRRFGPIETYLASLPERLPEPDLLALTGDFAEGSAALESCLRALAPLRAKHGRLAVLGNNDVRPRHLLPKLLKRLRALGFDVLQDECRRMALPGGAFWLGGLTYYHVRNLAHRFRFPVAETFAEATDAAPRILLSHTPDALPEAAAERVALMLSGHTHGGQICAPGGVPLHNNLYRSRGPDRVQGLLREGKTLGYVSRGLGMSGLPARTFCPPEVVQLTLRSPAGQAPNET